MCGIAGFVDPHGRIANDALDRVARDMADRLVHRGPDDAGEWVEGGTELARADRVAMSHRRLSIIDLSPAGHQPMVSASRRFVMVYNGEVYNYPDIRKELEAAGVRFRGDSDTEVILEAFDHWGIVKTLPRMIGMFAIALWDRESKELTLIRDRLGIKPLYWGVVNGTLLFASELKAMTAHPVWQPELNRDAVAAFMRHMYIPAPATVYRGIFKLQPGMLLRYRSGGEPALERYWDFRELAIQALEQRQMLDVHEAERQLNGLLHDAVRCRMIADVPLGSLLSGGIDSSLITALMQDLSDRPVRTFTIGFEEQQYDEAPFAREVARELGTEHTELYVRPADALDTIPNLAEWFDEPFADASQIPTYLVSKLTRQHVTVVLSGDGGDELFAGYSRYLQGARLWNRLQQVPRPLRSLLEHTLKRLPEEKLDAIARLLPARVRPAQFGRKVHKAAAGVSQPDADALYRQLLSHWDDPEALVLGAAEPKGDLWHPGYRCQIPNFIERMQFLDTLTYLPDDILTKVDRASMAVSLEARVPLLDHRVVEFAWRLPLAMKVEKGQGKLLLRRVLERYLPRHLIDRPKMGFGVPIDAWLRGPLRDWAESLLDERRLEQQGLLATDLVRSKWRAHLEGDNWAYPLWDVLMLQEWLDKHSVTL